MGANHIAACASLARIDYHPNCAPKGHPRVAKPIITIRNSRGAPFGRAIRNSQFNRTMSFFITFEGPEGGGKTTQTRLMQQTLERRGHAVVMTREPGGTAIGNNIRAILLDLQNSGMSPRAEVLLFNAARAQLVDEVIRPALASGQIVLCDRYADSSLAYQGYGRGQDLAELRMLIRFATLGLKPHLTVFLDIDPAQGLLRKRNNSLEEWNRMEAERLAFHQTVREGFLHLAAEEPARWLIVDAAQPVETVQAAIWQHIEQLLRSN